MLSEKVVIIDEADLDAINQAVISVGIQFIHQLYPLRL